MPLLLLPVGHSLGATVDPVSGAPVHRVRVGPDVVRLSEPQFALWALTHGAAADQDALLSTAADLPDAAALLTGLVDDGLVAAVEPGTPAAPKFAETHQLKPLMLGLGNLPDDPDTYEIGLPGQPVAAVGAVLYRLYQWGHLETDLWAACRATAAQSGAEFADPHRLLDAVLAAVATLLGPNAAYLDTAV
ncbi:hypothetical protein [Cryptosporangium minutisporangium]|uniref:Uncharacterized protein n=1 Tax=Cryptosporangium minutisporangium TaxID=113569 RepID=A0ABP6SXU7_9ACTN